MQNGKLIVTRTSPRDIKMRELVVRIDDGPEKILLFDQSYETLLAAGEHSILATNRLFTKTATFSLAEDETISFSVANVATGCFSALTVIGGAGGYRVFLERG